MPENINPALVVLVHPDTNQAAALTELLPADDITVLHTRSGQFIRELVENAHPEVVLCRADEALKDGAPVYELALPGDGTTQCILLAEREDLRHARHLVLEQRAYDYFVVNPAYDALHLELSVRGAIREARLRQEIKAWGTVLEEMKKDSANQVAAHKEGMLNELRTEVDLFRENAFPSAGGGPAEIKDTIVFNGLYSDLRDRAVEEVVNRKADQCGTEIKNALEEIPEKARNLPIMSIEERFARIPKGLAYLTRAVTQKTKRTQFHVMLIATDCPSFASALEHLADAGLKASLYADIPSADVDEAESQFDALVVDVTGHKKPTKRILELRKRVKPDCPIIVASHQVTDSMVKQCMKAGASDVILLPLSPAQLGSRIRQTLTADQVMKASIKSSTSSNSSASEPSTESTAS